jgi:hypothetical protein
VQLHKPTQNFSSYQGEGGGGGGILCKHKIFNTLSALTAELVNNNIYIFFLLFLLFFLLHFISMQKRFLIVELFYSINEYLNYQHEVKTDDSPITKAL